MGTSSGAYELDNVCAPEKRHHNRTKMKRDILQTTSWTSVLCPYDDKMVYDLAMYVSFISQTQPRINQTSHITDNMSL